MFYQNSLESVGFGAFNHMSELIFILCGRGRWRKLQVSSLIFRRRFQLGGTVCLWKSFTIAALGPKEGGVCSLSGLWPRKRGVWDMAEMKLTLLHIFFFSERSLLFINSYVLTYYAHLCAYPPVIYSPHSSYSGKTRWECVTFLLPLRRLSHVIPTNGPFLQGLFLLPSARGLLSQA